MFDWEITMGSAQERAAPVPISDHLIFYFSAVFENLHTVDLLLHGPSCFGRIVLVMLIVYSAT